MNRKELEQTIIEFLKRHNGGTLATVREDGIPQASGISFVNDGLTIYSPWTPRVTRRGT